MSLRELFLFLLLLFAPCASATQLPGMNQEEDGNETPAEDAGRTAEDLEAEKAGIHDELVDARERLATARESNAPEAEDISEEVDFLQRLELAFDQAIQLLEHTADLGEEREQLANELARVRATGPTELPPYSIRFLDRLRDELDVEKDKKLAFTSEVESQKASLESMRDEASATERARRQALEKLNNATDPGDQAVFGRELRLAELASRMARENVELLTLELTDDEHELQVNDVKLKLLEAQIDWVAQTIVLAPEDKAAILGDLDREEMTLEAEERLTTGALRRAESKWLTATGQLDESADRPAELVERVEALFQAKELLHDKEQALTGRLARLSQRRKTWERRFKAVEGEELEEKKAREWIEESTAAIKELRHDESLEKLRNEPLRNAWRAIGTRLERASDLTEPVRVHLQSQRDSIEERIKLHEANTASMETLRRLHQRLIIDLGGDSAGTFAVLLESIWDGVVHVWTYELATVQETPITVHKIIVGLLILILGIRASRIISRFLGNKILPGVGLEVPAAAAVRTIVFYLLTLTFILFALNFVNVPLTVFTVLGGALAIGVGFGSQNIVNNFISGLILLVEQPVRVGDLIQIGDLYGNVVRIGARSTHVKTGANVEIMVPNSSFLENNVVNLTLTNRKIRTFVGVGAAYGSPVRDVTRLMKKAAVEHGRVLKHPEPLVLFEQFADNSLNFEVHFWIRTDKVMERRMIESDIRKRIDALFREAKIEIAFPQRDVHLNTKGPIEVTVVEPQAVATEESANADSSKPVELP